MNKSIHFVGIGGIGMSGLAAMYKSYGYEVSGSDRDAEKPDNQFIIEPLRRQGIKIYPQDGSFIQCGIPDFLVYSSAIENGNPDLLVVENTKTEVLHRSKALQKIIEESNFKTTVAVSGSCGKSTVCAYLSETLTHLNVDVSCLNGAIVKAFRTEDFAGNFRFGQSGIFVFEADESDKSLVNYTPDYAIVLNIGTDHYEKAELGKIFTEFLNRTKKGAVISHEVYELVKDGLRSDLPILIFSEKLGKKSPDELYVSNYQVVEKSSKVMEKFKDSLLDILGFHSDNIELKRKVIEVEFNQQFVFELPLSGLHNAVNALAIFGMLQQIGPFSSRDILKALSRFGGVFRRFDFCGITPQGAYVYDDYAHNPEKIIACLKCAIELATNQVFIVFQPHGYSPLGFMQDELFHQLELNLKSGCFFVMLEPFYAGGTSSFKPKSADVISIYQSRSRKSDQYIHMQDRDSLRAFLAEKTSSGDIIVIAGARDNSLASFAKSLTQLQE